MFAASLETSEPEMFMAIPRSAFLSAGESLTPSPVLIAKCQPLSDERTGQRKLTLRRYDQEPVRV